MRLVIPVQRSRNCEVMSHGCPLSLIGDFCWRRSPCLRRYLVTSAVPRRHHRRRLLKYSPTYTPTQHIFKLSDDAIEITLQPPLNSIQQLEMRLGQLIDYSREAFDDLKTVVTVNNQNGGIVISCKRSTVEFFAVIMLSTVVSIIAFRALFKFRKNDGEKLIYRRDRSLGGREVLVGKTDAIMATRRGPLASNSNLNYLQKKRTVPFWGRRKEQLPKWWPQLSNLGSHETSNKEEKQSIVDQLIREMTDRKMNGEDISANDIIQLRHICKSYGVRANINTENARDSLYRAAIVFVLNYCESMSNESTLVQINGEDARDFIAGLSDNIKLENTRAARMVSAAVAAHTRSRILQAWALEVQNKHSEALVELFRVCLIHRHFPPEDGSPEMEMVAQGLTNSLTIEQRESILNSFSIACGDDMHQSVVEALGLGEVNRGISMHENNAQ